MPFLISEEVIPLRDQFSRLAKTDFLIMLNYSSNVALQMVKIGLEEQMLDGELITQLQEDT
jgi:hypothetical protein